MSTDVPLAPFVQREPGLHDAHWVLGEPITIRVPGEASGGQLAVTEHEANQGTEVPLHRQNADDETWYVLGGAVVLDGRSQRADDGFDRRTRGTPRGRASLAS